MFNYICNSYISLDKKIYFNDIKAMTETVVPNGLVQFLLAFGTMPTFPDPSQTKNSKLNSLKPSN